METSTVDAEEIAHFTAMADEWWDATGKFAPLHAMNPLRIQFIRDHIAAHYGRDVNARAPFSGLTLLDIGSGGGLLCEPMARLGATVTGVDAAEKNTHIARLHAEQMGLDIDYRHTTAEALAWGDASRRSEPSAVSSANSPYPLQQATDGANQYDIVFALEIVEHVADVEAFLAAVSALVKPGGLLFMSTLNRTMKSYATAIIGAEYVLRWLPKGTHHWKKFLRPSELILPLEAHGIKTHDLQGMVYDPFNASWSLNPTALDVNYIFAAKK